MSTRNPLWERLGLRDLAVFAGDKGHDARREEERWREGWMNKGGDSITSVTLSISSPLPTKSIL